MKARGGRPRRPSPSPITSLSLNLSFVTNSGEEVDDDGDGYCKSRRVEKARLVPGRVAQVEVKCVLNCVFLKEPMRRCVMVLAKLNGVTRDI